MELDLGKIEGFQWDDANRDKNWEKHQVATGECEQIFFNQPLLILEDPKHSLSEKRLSAFGKTDVERHLVIVYTIRKNLIRVISARGMNKKERKFYEEESKKNTNFQE